MRKTRRRFRVRQRSWSESGQALLEFALVLPLLMMLIVGVFEFSRAWHAKQTLTQAARDALRSAVVADPDFTQDAMYALVNDALARAAMDPGRASISFAGWRTGTGSPARIQIEYPYDFALLGPLMGWVSGDGSVTLSTSFVMRNE